MQVESKSAFRKRFIRFIAFSEVGVFLAAYFFSMADPNWSNFLTKLLYTGIVTFLVSGLFAGVVITRDHEFFGYDPNPYPVPFQPSMGCLSLSIAGFLAVVFSIIGSVIFLM
jgi:hypothetical protein